MAEILHFKISSGLKNIIGRELINDKYIAIFELVKNSYDAGASYAKIIFDNLGTNEASIAILDDGKGMNKDDIINKWLFVAYSEKKNPSYRDNIKRAVAGAKGVGRFSCDRLGERVILSSKTKEDNYLHNIAIKWNDFEENSLDNFTDIDVHYEKNECYDNKSGTKIVIKDLRENWERTDLLALKKALSQLVNPSATNEYDSFEIFLDVPSEKETDDNFSDENNKVNGKITNNIFDVINQKTTRIDVSISEDGKSLQTVLNDRGIFLFETIEKNEFSLCNIRCTLYFLNKAAKYNFTRKMGIEAVNYGSIFVYKNGFRVYPYGEPGQDFFDIDQRKQQGYKRNLGTREVIGQIEINGEKNNLVETSSRNNGFIGTHHLDELKTFFLEYVLKPLEKYLVNVAGWGTTENLFDSEVDEDVLFDANKLLKKIKFRTKESSYLSIRFNDNLYDYFKLKKESAESSTDELERLVAATNDENIIEKASKVIKQTKELEREVIRINQEAERVQEKLDDAHAEIKIQTKQIGILSARADLKAQDAIDAMHIMKGYADTIDSYIAEVYESAEEEKIDISPLRYLFDNISQVCKKIMNSYNLVMRTNYSANSDYNYVGLVQFVEEYCKEFGSSINVKVEKSEYSVANVKFNPLEFSIILDNLIDNATKANAKNVYFSFEKQDDNILLHCMDDGFGLNSDAKEEKIFDPGYTTTAGTGIGLSTVKKYVEKAGGKVTYNPDYKNGFEVILHLRNGH